MGSFTDNIICWYNDYLITYDLIHLDRWYASMRSTLSELMPERFCSLCSKIPVAHISPPGTYGSTSTINLGIPYSAPEACSRTGRYWGCWFAAPGRPHGTMKRRQLNHNSWVEVSCWWWWYRSQELASTSRMFGCSSFQSPWSYHPTQ